MKNKCIKSSTLHLQGFARLMEELYLTAKKDSKQVTEKVVLEPKK